MPAFSFKERFVPMVKDGTKRQTVRSFRKTCFMPGKPAHLFYGMRTKHCSKLIENSPAITNVVSIFINNNGDVFIIEKQWLPEDYRKRILTASMPELMLKNLPGYQLTEAQKDAFAWFDGFRHADDAVKRKGCFDIMFRWWKQTHDLPFLGAVIYW